MFLLTIKAIRKDTKKKKNTTKLTTKSAFNLFNKCN